MILALVATFAVQSVLVYTDASPGVPLDAQALAGRRLWQGNNCQACHQLHGFGGFLGPDLTNAAERLERGQLDTILTQGMGQMPAFEMSAEQIDAIWAFVSAMDQTGRGQARNPGLAPLTRRGGGVDSPSARALRQVIDESEDELVAQGYEVFQAGTCMACHRLYARSQVGAPDLSISGGVLSADEIMAVLEAGRPPKMPPPSLSPSDRERVRAFLIFLAEHRADAMARVARQPAPLWTSLPWWEY